MIYRRSIAACLLVLLTLSSRLYSQSDLNKELEEQIACLKMTCVKLESFRPGTSQEAINAIAELDKCNVDAQELRQASLESRQAFERLCAEKWKVQLRLIQEAFLLPTEEAERLRLMKLADFNMTFVNAYENRTYEQYQEKTRDLFADQERLIKTFIADPNNEISTFGKVELTKLYLNIRHTLSALELEKLKNDISETILTNNEVDFLGVLIRNTICRQDSKEFAAFLEPLLIAMEQSKDESVSKRAAELRPLFSFLLLPGKEMILNGQSLEGETIDLEEYHGKVVLIDFWAIWCGHCVAEFPKLKKLHDAYRPHGFEIIGVNVDGSRQRVRDFLVARDLPWPTIHERDDPNNLRGIRDSNAQRYGLNDYGVPVSILVGRDGKVISICARGNRLDKLLAEQFPGVAVSLPLADAPAVE